MRCRPRIPDARLRMMRVGVQREHAAILVEHERSHHDQQQRESLLQHALRHETHQVRAAKDAHDRHARECANEGPRHLHHSEVDGEGRGRVQCDHQQRGTDRLLHRRAGEQHQGRNHQEPSSDADDTGDHTDRKRDRHEQCDPHRLHRADRVRGGACALRGAIHHCGRQQHDGGQQRQLYRAVEEPRELCTAVGTDHGEQRKHHRRADVHVA